MKCRLSHRIVLAAVVSTIGCVSRTNGTDLLIASPAAVKSPVPRSKPLVQLAILLDTSGSMSGLIDQARTELWSIVNQFISARQKGVAPEVQVALFEYGNDGLPQEKGYIRQIVAFTTDLDQVSQELFGLKTNGGSEYCGWVIKDAVERLQWTADPNGLKVLFIAGNEPFTQGPIDYRQACKAAIEKGIVVNTLHCGPEAEGVNGQWDSGARLADGRYLAIDHNRQVAYIAAPQDGQIAALDTRLNGTYIAFGRYGMAFSERQSAQDTNARVASPQAAAQRAVAKASPNYVNADWDLVDAVDRQQADLEKIPDDQLPQAMRGLSLQEKKAYVVARSNERSEIQRQIQALNLQREQYVAAERAKQQTSGNTLGSAIVQAMRQQAGAKQFDFVDGTSQGEHP